MNRYVYTRNDPINLVDPTGNQEAEYALPIQQDVQIGGPTLSTIAAYTIGGIALTAVIFLVAQEVVHAPPRTNWWEWISNHPVQPSNISPPEPDSGGGAPGWPIAIAVALWYLLHTQSPTPQPTPTPPAPQPTPGIEPEYVYRDGSDRAKTVRLYRPKDWKTGLSFWDSPPQGQYIRFKVSTLETHGYVVNPDGGTPSVYLPFFGGGLYMGIRQTLPLGHATVYYNNEAYWTQWYEDEQKYINITKVSPQTEALYALRER